MADKEISALTAATTPLAGTELVHVDQGGNSRKATLSDVVALSTGAMLKATYDPNDDGIIAVANGGTNAATASDARVNLGLGTMAVQNAATVNITGGTVTGITDLAVADGGTGASTAAAARANLDLEPGVDVQAYLGTGVDGEVLKWQSGNPVWGTVAGTGDMVGANNLSEVVSISEARGNLKVPPIVADIAALRSANVDPDIDPAVFVRGSGIKPKRYVWYAGNYSASQFVTADTDGIAYVKANKYATSVGAYIFSPETHVINAVNDFGFQTGQSASTDGSTSYDNTPNMNLLYTYLNPQGGDVNFPARRGTECYFPQGTYWFKSKPVDPPCRFTFEGAGSSWTTFMRAYNEATFTNGFFNPRLSLCAGHTIQGISVIAATGTTGGRAYSNIASATEQASDITLDDFVSTTIGGGSWADYGTVIDGQLKTTGSVGIRVPVLNNLECFAGPSGSLLLRSCVAPAVTACGAYSAGGTTGKVVIDGVSAVNNYYGTFDFSNLAGLEILRCETANVRAGYIVGDVLFGANAENAVVYCPHINGDVTFTSGAANCVVVGRVSGTVTGAGVNGCQVVDPTKNNWETIFDGAVSGAHYELGGLSAYKTIHIRGNLIATNDNSDAFLRLGTTTVASGASDYLYQIARGTGTGNATATGSTATSAILLSPYQIGNASGECIQIDIVIQNFNKALYSSVDGRVGVILSTGAGGAAAVFGQRLQASAHDIFRIFLTSNMVAGSDLTVRGWRG